jgi:predicted nucleotidyltransferase
VIHPEIEARLEKLKQVLICHKVKEAYIFGSAVTESFSKDSDLDLLIEFDPVAEKDIRMSIEARPFVRVKTYSAL